MKIRVKSGSPFATFLIVLIFIFENYNYALGLCYNTKAWARVRFQRHEISSTIQINRFNQRKRSLEWIYAVSQSPHTDVPSRVLVDMKIKQSVKVLLLVSFLPLLGFTMCSPLLPSLGQHFSLKLGSAAFGLLTTAYPLGMFFGVFFWSHLSDLMGRKRTLMWSLLGSSLGLFMQAKAIASHWPIKTFLLMRVLTGAFAGSNQIVKAYLADLASPTTTDTTAPSLPKYLAWRDAACTMAYIIGPLSGGSLFHFLVSSPSKSLPIEQALTYVIRTTAVTTLIGAGLIATCTTNARDEQNFNLTPNRDGIKESSNTIAFHSNSQPNQILSCPVGLGSSLWSGIIIICIASFLFHIADSTFFSFFPALLQTEFSFGAQKIGLTFTTFATISFALSASSVSSTLIQRWDVVPTCALGLALIATGLASLAVTTSDFFPSILGTIFPCFDYKRMNISTIGGLFSGMLYFCGVSLYSPTIPFMLLQCVPPQQRGRVMGLDGAINTIARIVSPLVLGEVYRLNGAGVTFGVSSLAVVSSIFMILQSRRIMN